MKTQILSLMFLAALVFSILSVSAAVFSFSTSPSDLTKSATTTSAVITAGSSPINITSISLSTTTISDGKGHTIDLVLSYHPATFLNGTSTTVNVTATTADFSALALDSYPITFTVNAVDAVNSSINLSDSRSFNFQSGYCKLGSKDTNENRYLEILSVKDLSSDTKFEWKPGDSVDLSVKVNFESNKSDESIDAVIDVELYDSLEHKFVEFDNQDDLERSISLDEGSTDTEEFTLDVPIDDTLEDASGRYRLYVKVYQDGKETSLCKDYDTDSEYYKEVTINRNSYEVALKNIQINSPVVCGEESTITATAYNIGSNDEDKVYTNVFNNELKLNVNSSVFALDQGDSKKVILTFLVPANATEKTYELYLTNYFKYSKSTDEYRDFTEEPYKVDLVVSNCVAKNTGASITAELSSDTPRAVVGNQVVVEATVKNTGSVSTTYNMAVSGNTQWSKVANIDPQSFTLDVGESKKVSIYLDINKDATAGDEQFTITANYAGTSTNQKVLLPLEEGLTQDKILNHLRTYWYVYVIALITLILLIIIIVLLARRTSD